MAIGDRIRERRERRRAEDNLFNSTMSILYGNNWANNGRIDPRQMRRQYDANRDMFLRQAANKAVNISFNPAIEDIQMPELSIRSTPIQQAPTPRLTPVDVISNYKPRFPKKTITPRNSQQSADELDPDIIYTAPNDETFEIVVTPTGSYIAGYGYNEEGQIAGNGQRGSGSKPYINREGATAEQIAAARGVNDLSGNGTNTPRFSKERFNVQRNGNGWYKINDVSYYAPEYAPNSGSYYREVNGKRERIQPYLVSKDYIEAFKRAINGNQ